MQHPATSLTLGIYPADLARSWAAVYGQWLTIRPIRADDMDIETAFFDGLSETTRYNRFLSGGVQADAAMLERFTNIDYADHMALIATLMLEDAEIQVGVARYIVDQHGDAEFAIVLADAWQGCGLGRRLLEALLEHAGKAGIGKLYGDVLATNQPMLALAGRLGFEITAHPEGATLRLIRKTLGATTA